MKFALAIHKEPESDYGVTVLDLPGCFSAGETVDEAMDQAKEAIECHLEAMIQDEEAIPQSRPLEHHKNSPDNEGAVFAYVDVDLTKFFPNISDSLFLAIDIPYRNLIYQQWIR